MLDLALLLGKYAFLALLSLFLWQLYRVTLADLKAAQQARSAPGGEARLVVVVGTGGLAAGQGWPLRGRLTIGRSGDNVIEVNDTFCSQHHAAVWLQDQRVWAEDLNSTNGTLLDGRPLVPGQATELTAGASLRLGETVLRYER